MFRQEREALARLLPAYRGGSASGCGRKPGVTSVAMAAAATFLSSIAASTAGFCGGDFFEVEATDERETPRVGVNRPGAP